MDTTKQILIQGDDFLEQLRSTFKVDVCSVIYICSNSIVVQASYLYNI